MIKRSATNRHGALPRSLRVAAAQMVFRDSIAENLDQIRCAALKAAHSKADVILFPECATTGYGFPFESLNRSALHSALRSIGELASSLGIYLIVGSPMFCGRGLFNAILVFDRRGHLAHTYAKCQLTASDERFFARGRGLSFFSIDGIPCTSILCHERRYPELVRLPAMAGARIVFHPNAGMDSLKVSKTKRQGRDGIAVRAFENAIFYVFANSVGPQGEGLWSAGDSKIVAPSGRVLKLADNRKPCLLIQDLELPEATRRYAQDSLKYPAVLARFWPRILRTLKSECRVTDAKFRRALLG